MSQDVIPGSASWWAARANTGRGRTLNTPMIVERTLEMIDAQGLGSITMRTVAKELGTGAASLYRHVESRDALLLLVMDHIFGLIVAHLELAEGLTWDEALRTMALIARRTMLDHGHAIPILAMGPHVGPMSLALQECVLGALIDEGLAPRDALLSFNALAQWVIGFVISEYETSERRGTTGLLAERIASLDPERFPRLRSLDDSLLPVEPDDEFAFGLDVLLAGLATRIGQTAD